MKKWICAALAMVMLLGCAGAVAQEYVSIQEVYDQAQAMGGWWKETFDTPNGQVTIDAPIIVPDVEKMPVITVEGAKISEEKYKQVIQGKKVGDADEIQYELDMNGSIAEFFLGRENDKFKGKETNKWGYDAVDMLWIQHGDYRFGIEGGVRPKARPITFHYPWEIDMDKAYMRGSNMTVNDIMRLWREDIEMSLGEGYEIRPSWIEVRGSNLIENPGSGKAFKSTGYTYVFAEQYIEGFPVFGAIASRGAGRIFHIPYGAAEENVNKKIEKLEPYAMGAAYSCMGDDNMQAWGQTDETYRTMTYLVDVRSLEYEDVPLAPLGDVLSSVAKDIEAGHIRAVRSVRLGYLLYSNPEMVDHAWAIPRWTVECEYERNAKKEKKVMMKNEDGLYVSNDEDGPWGNVKLPVDAQSGKLIIYTTGDKETFRVPDMLTWDKVK